MWGALAENPVIRVFLADYDEEHLLLERSVLDRRPGLQVVGTAQKGDEACECILRAPPDVLVTDLLLSGMDGISLVRRVRKSCGKLRVILLSAFVSDYTARSARVLGVSDYLAKPCDPNLLADRIREVMEEGLPWNRRSLEPLIRRALLQFGITPNLNGHAYLVEAIRRAMEDPGNITGITKILYPDLGRHFNTTAGCIEHSIRSAISGAWERGSAERRSILFSGIFDQFPKAPSNAKFLTAMCEYLQLGLDNP